MKLSDFDYGLPSGRIAQRPISPRDSARLLAVDDPCRDHVMTDLPNLLQPRDLLVFNNTRVIPTRLVGKRLGKQTAAKIEVTLHKEVSPESWRAFAKPARKLKTGDRIDFTEDFSAKVREKGDGGEITLAFDRAGDPLRQALQRHGAMPLPPYIKRAALPDAQDHDDYQTVFAEHPGAVAAPTAGLHFTPALLESLKQKSIGHVFLTLHVGAGTFLPVKTETVEDHTMHAEWGAIDETAADAINRTRKAGGRIVPVGTTSLRLLETAAAGDGTVRPFSGETSLFITPGYRFQAVDMLLTNFHLPKSTLFMLVCAFAGTARMKAAYEHAIEQDYRFYSYGDACLLTRENSS